MNPLMVLFDIICATVLVDLVYSQTCLPGCTCSDFLLKMIKCNSEVSLTSFPYNIDRGMEFIRFPGNQIGELPSNLSKIVPDLQKLELRNNKIKVLRDKTFAGLKKLRYLSLTNNEITTIGADLFQGNEFTQMILIILSGNKISKIDPTAFKSLSTADVSLRLNQNSIKDLHQDLLAGLRNLQTIDLSNNKIERLDPAQFSSQGRAYFIKLSGNKLTSLHVDTFKNAALLDTLELRGNDIEYLPNDIFRNNPVLREIDLRENQFSRLPVDLYLPKDVQKIKIQGNPIVCDCGLKKLNFDSNYISKFDGFNDIICANDPERSTVKKYLEALNCETTTSTTPTTTMLLTNGTTDGSNSSSKSNLTAGENKHTVITITRTTTRFVFVDKTSGGDKSSWPIVLGVLLGVIVLIVCVGLLLYLYRRKIRDKLVEGKMTLTRRKKKLNSADSAEEFQYHDAAGWTGASTAMLKKTEGNV